MPNEGFAHPRPVLGVCRVLICDGGGEEEVEKGELAAASNALAVASNRALRDTSPSRGESGFTRDVASALSGALDRDAEFFEFAVEGGAGETEDLGASTDVA